MTIPNIATFDHGTYVFEGFWRVFNQSCITHTKDKNTCSYSNVFFPWHFLAELIHHGLHQTKGIQVNVQESQIITSITFLVPKTYLPYLLYDAMAMPWHSKVV